MIPGILSSFIFLITLLAVFSGRINRIIASMAGAVVMVVTGLALNFYTEEQASASIDLNTVGLLLGMMLIVSILEPTGFFQYLAIWVARLSKGNTAKLLIFLGSITTLVSMFLDNVTTVVLIAPVTILLCEILGINSQPYLMAEALLSDTGGVATLVGDPPNILISSAAGFTFLDFLTHSLPIVLIVWFSALGLLFILFKKELAQKPIDIEALMDLNPKSALKDGKTTKRTIVILSLMIFIFLFEEFLQIKPSLVALGGASLALLWIRPSIQETLKRIQWDVLIFFAALFVLIGGMESAGVFDELHNLTAALSSLHPILLGVILLWIVSILSAFVDNVPITIALIPVIQGFEISGIPTAPLWWALVLGAGFGGNGTIIGSTANIVVASLSEKTRNPITPILWNKRGLPVMICTTIIATICYVLFYGLLVR